MFFLVVNFSILCSFYNVMDQSQSEGAPLDCTPASGCSNATMTPLVNQHLLSQRNCPAVFPLQSFWQVPSPCQGNRSPVHVVRTGRRLYWITRIFCSRLSRRLSACCASLWLLEYVGPTEKVRIEEDHRKQAEVVWLYYEVKLTTEISNYGFCCVCARFFSIIAFFPCTCTMLLLC